MPAYPSDAAPAGRANGIRLAFNAVARDFAPLDCALALVHFRCGNPIAYACAHDSSNDCADSVADDAGAISRPDAVASTFAVACAVACADAIADGHAHAAPEPSSDAKPINTAKSCADSRADTLV